MSKFIMNKDKNGFINCGGFKINAAGFELMSKLKSSLPKNFENLQAPFLYHCECSSPKITTYKYVDSNKDFYENLLDLHCMNKTPKTKTKKQKLKKRRTTQKNNKFHKKN